MEYCVFAWIEVNDHVYKGFFWESEKPFDIENVDLDFCFDRLNIRVVAGLDCFFNLSFAIVLSEQAALRSECDCTHVTWPPLDLCDAG